MKHKEYQGRQAGRFIPVCARSYLNLDSSVTRPLITLLSPPILDRGEHEDDTIGSIFGTKKEAGWEDEDRNSHLVL